METTEHAAPVKVQGMDEHGWSNSSPVKEAPEDVHPDVNVDLSQEPGWSNVKLSAKDVKAIEEAESKVVQPQTVEDKSVAKKTTSRKAKG